MRLAFELSGRRRLMWLAMIALVAGASFAWAWGVKSAHSPSSSAAAMIAARFPAEWIAHTPKSAAAFVLARASPQETPALDNGMLVVPSRPGLGLAFDKKAIEKYEVR